MNGIEKHVEYYRAYLPHDRSLFPLRIGLATVVAFGLLLYLVSAVGPQLKENVNGPVNPASARHATISSRAAR